jgi:hypothetical protein
VSIFALKSATRKLQFENFFAKKRQNPNAHLKQNGLGDPLKVQIKSSFLGVFDFYSLISAKGGRNSLSPKL